MVDIIDNLKTKMQTRFFTNKEVDKELILNALKAAHTYVPSRDNKVPYKIKVLGPTEEDWKYKKELYSYSRCGVNWSDPDFFIFNEQVLAPYVVCFYPGNDPMSRFEVGMFAITFLSECTKQGLDVGFCGAFGDWKERPLCTLGIGYGIKSENGHKYFKKTYRNQVLGYRKHMSRFINEYREVDGRKTTALQRKAKGYIKWEHWK